MRINCHPKLSTLLCLPALLGALVLPAQTPELKVFTIPDGHASVLMPGTPVFETQDVTLKGGVKVPLNDWYVQLENKNISYMLMYSDYPSNYANGASADMLLKFRDGAVNGKTLLSDQAIQLGGIPGREFSAKDKDGWIYYVRHYFVNKRLYQLIVVCEPTHTPTYREAFLNSFQIK